MSDVGQAEQAPADPTNSPADAARYGRWLDLWRALVANQRHAHVAKEGRPTDPWRDRARDFNTRVRRRLNAPDLHRDFVLARVDSTMTVLDIGAGTGGWAIPLARKAGKVTCVEPSEAMREVLSDNVREFGLTNVEIIAGQWPGTTVEPHDVTLCSHAMYAEPDYATFIRAMLAVTRKLACLVMRLPVTDGVMGLAAQRVFGHPHDSPNFVVGYNALLELGIYPNVLVEPTLWRPWTSPSLDDALVDIKRRLGLRGASEHDQWLAALLASRLTLTGDEYVWPAGVRSALAYWEPAVGGGFEQ